MLTFIVRSVTMTSGHLIARIADGFQLANLAEHNADFILCLVRNLLRSQNLAGAGYLLGGGSGNIFK